MAVFRSELLRSTETYVRNQGEAVQRYRSHYVGLRRVEGLELPEDRTLVLNTGDRLGRAREALFERFGVSPTLDRAVRALRPAVVHAHLGYDGVTALPLVRRLGVPLVTTFHGSDATVNDEELLRLGGVYRAYVHRRDALKRHGRLFIAVSEFVRGRMIERGWPDERIAVHYIGVDTECLRPDPAVVREPIVFFAGRLMEVKGVTHLIVAMRAVQARVPEAELVVAGRGKLRQQLERQASEAGVRARFLGVASPAEVRAWMNRARVFCLSSVTAATGHTEALSTVAMEAQAMGLPVVAFHSGGTAEAVVDGETGLLVRERDEVGLAERITALLTEPPLWTRLSAAGMERVRARFDLRRQTALLEELYDAARRPVPGRAATRG